MHPFDSFHNSHEVVHQYCETRVMGQPAVLLRLLGQNLRHVPLCVRVVFVD